MGELEIVGYLAGMLVAFALSPQLIKTWKTRSVGDISLLWTLTLLAGVFLWLVYGVANRIMPIMAFASIELAMISALLGMKFVYEKK